MVKDKYDGVCTGTNMFPKSWQLLYYPNFEVKIFSAVNKNILVHFHWSPISLAVKRVGLAEHVSLVDIC